MDRTRKRFPGYSRPTTDSRPKNILTHKDIAKNRSRNYIIEIKPSEAWNSPSIDGTTDSFASGSNDITQGDIAENTCDNIEISDSDEGDSPRPTTDSRPKNITVLTHKDIAETRSRNYIIEIIPIDTWNSPTMDGTTDSFASGSNHITQGDIADNTCDNIEISDSGEGDSPRPTIDGTRETSPCASDDVTQGIAEVNTCDNIAINDSESRDSATMDSINERFVCHLPGMDYYITVNDIEEEDTDVDAPVIDNSKADSISSHHHGTEQQEHDVAKGAEKTGN